MKSGRPGLVVTVHAVASLGAKDERRAVLVVRGVAARVEMTTVAGEVAVAEIGRIAQPMDSGNDWMRMVSR